MNIVNRKDIGEIGNAYGGLEVGIVDGYYCWNINGVEGNDWQKIPKSLYDELIKFQESTDQPRANLSE